MKKLFLGILTLVVSLSVFGFTASADETEWIEVSTPEELDAIRDNLEGNYRLVNDIDLSDWGEWEPIGQGSKTTGVNPAFNGSLDGQGYTIKNLTITNDYQQSGLFGSTHHADSISNLILEDVYINSSVTAGSAGALIGHDYSPSPVDIINVHVISGEVNSEGPVGGLIGGGRGPNIYDSSSSANVSSSSSGAGGLLGFMRTTSSINHIIENSYATGNVTGERSGGLVGSIYTRGGSSRKVTYSNSYATGDITGESIAGGLIGRINSQDTIKFSSLYSTGKVEGNDDIGGLVGRGSHAEINNPLFWDATTSTLNDSTLGEGKTTNEMYQKETFVGWDFNNVWTIDEGNDYPKLRFHVGEENNGDNGSDDDDENGDGSNGDSSQTQERDVSITIRSGNLELDAPNIHSFESITLPEEITSYKTSFDGLFQVRDLRGTHKGYRVDVSASPFTDGENTLPNGSLSLSPLESITRVGDSNGDAPVNVMDDQIIIDDGVVSVLEAEQGTGTGVFDFEFPEEALELVIDPSTTVVNGDESIYTSTVTWDLVSAP